jgi:DNA-binding SARP family transcriptional activator
MAYYAQRQKMALAVKQLSDRYAAAQTQLKEEVYRWRMADVNASAYATGADPVYNNSIVAERARLDQWAIQIQSQQEKLGEMQEDVEAAQKQLNDYFAAEPTHTTVRAFVTGDYYNGIPVLQCAQPGPGAAN